MSRVPNDFGNDRRECSSSRKLSTLQITKVLRKKLVFVYLWQMKVTQQELETRKTHAPDSKKTPKEKQDRHSIQIQIKLTRRCRVAFQSQEKKTNTLRCTDYGHNPAALLTPRPISFFREDNVRKLHDSWLNRKINNYVRWLRKISLF